MTVRAHRARARLPLLVLVLQLLALGALAQDGSAPARERQARTAFEAGVAATEAGDYARAREEFLRSRELVVKASTLLNLAVVDLKLGLVEEALAALDALELAARSPDHERMLQRARQLRSEAESLRPHAAEANAALAAPDAAPRASARELGVPEAEGAPAPRALEASAPLAPPIAAPPRSLNGPRALLITAGVLAGAAIGGAVWWQDRSQAVDACTPEADRVCTERAQIEREQTAAKALTLSLGVSALALATAGSIWLVRRKQDVRDTRVSAWAAPGTLGLSLRGTF